MGCDKWQALVTAVNSRDSRGSVVLSQGKSEKKDGWKAQVNGAGPADENGCACPESP